MSVQETQSITFEAKNVTAFMKGIKDSSKALTEQAKAAEVSARELQKQINTLKQADQPNKQLIKSQTLQAQAARLNAAEFKAQAAALNQEAKAAQAANKSTDDLTKRILAQSVAIVGTTAAIAGIGFGVAQAVKSFGDFERTLNTIKAVSGATASDLDAIKKSSLDLGAKTVFSNQQVADSYLELSRAGFTVQESLQAMPGLLTLAAAAGGDLGSAATITAGILRGFNKDASESGHVADVLAQAANVSAGEITDFGMALKQLAPVALSSNQSLEDMTGLLAVLSNRMINGADAGTDLKAILIRLVTPDTQKQIKALGIQVTDTSGKIKPLIDIVEQLQTKFKKLNQAGQLQVAAKIAGVENVKSLLALINTSKDELEEFTNKMKLADGQAQLMADTINQGVNTALEQFSGSVETLATSIGEKLAPAVVGLLTNMTALVNVLAQNDGLQSFMIGAASAATTAGVLTTALIAIPPALSAIRAGSATLAATLGVSTGGLTFLLAGLVAVGGEFGVMLERNAQLQRNMAQTTLELRGEIDRATDSAVREGKESVKLAQEYDELAKKKKLTKGETERLADITDSIITQLGLEGVSVDELTRKYGSLTAAIREKVIANAIDARSEEIKDQIKQAKDTRGLAEDQAARLKSPVVVAPAPGISVVTGIRTGSDEQVRKAQQNLERQKNKITFLNKQLKTVDADTRKLYDAIANPPQKAPPPSGTQNAPSTAKTKKKTDKTAQIERQKIQDIRDNLSNSLQDIDIEYTNRSKALGAFASEAEKVNLEVEKAGAKTEALKKFTNQLVQVDLKSAEGNKEREKALRDTRQSIEQNAGALLDYRNQIDSLDDATKRSVLRASNEAGQIKLDAAIETRKVELEATKRQLEKQFNEGKITQEEFYDSQKDLIQRNANLDQLAVKNHIDALKDEMDQLRDNEQDNQRRRDITNEILGLEQKIKVENAKTLDNVRQINEEEEKRALSKRLQNSFESDLSQAIQDALTGQGVLGAIKQFAKSFRNNVVKELADGLSKKITPYFQAIFDGIAGFIQRSLGQTASGSTVSQGLNTGGLSGGAVGQGVAVPTGQKLKLSKGQAGASIAGAALYAGGQYLAGKQSTAAQVGGVGLSAAGGALAGAAIGSLIAPGIGTAIGALIGGIGGGVSGVGKAVNAKQPGFFTKLAAGDGFFNKLFLGGIFRKSAKQKMRAYYQQTELQPFLDNLVNGADPNNLQDLIARRTQAGRGKPGRGSNGARAKQAAMAQIDELIKAREKSIADALKTLDKQNEELRDSIRLADAKPFERAAIEREIALKQITFDTQQLLDQFKDSQEAQTKILEQESLKRQQLQQQEQEAAKQDFEDLQDLLKQRDAVSNSNVFTRAQSAEQIKATQLASLDKQIAEAYQVIKGNLAAGIAPKNIGDYQTLVGQANQLSNVQLSVVINESTDAQQTQEMINRAFDSFLRSAYGANGV